MKSPPTFHPDCGTNRGYQRHIRAQEDTCPPCRTAHSAYTARKADRESQAAYNRARHKALARLARKHRGEYAVLLAEERAKQAREQAGEAVADDPAGLAPPSSAR